MSEFNAWQDELDGARLEGRRWIPARRPLPARRLLALAAAAPIVALLLACALGLAGCAPQPHRAVQAVEAADLVDVELGGPAPWWCGDGAAFSATFTAWEEAYGPVTGAVCADHIGHWTVYRNATPAPAPASKDPA